MVSPAPVQDAHVVKSEDLGNPLIAARRTWRCDPKQPHKSSPKNAREVQGERRIEPNNICSSVLDQVFQFAVVVPVDDPAFGRALNELSDFSPKLV
jgi:hypothetical protein